MDPTYWLVLGPLMLVPFSALMYIVDRIRK